MIMKLPLVSGVCVTSISSAFQFAKNNFDSIRTKKST